MHVTLYTIKFYIALLARRW